MTKYILESTVIKPQSKDKPKQDYRIMSWIWWRWKRYKYTCYSIGSRFLPDAIFLCPNGPEICSINPQGLSMV